MRSSDEMLDNVNSTNQEDIQRKKEFISYEEYLHEVNLGTYKPTINKPVVVNKDDEVSTELPF